MMAIVLHKQSNHEIDLFKVIKMLLIHDLVEIDAGDTWKKYGITSEQVLNRNSEIADGSESLWNYAEQIIKKSIDQGDLS